SQAAGVGGQGVVEPPGQDVLDVTLPLLVEQAGPPGQLFREVVGVGLLQQQADLFEEARRAAQLAVEPVQQVGRQLAPVDPLVHGLVAAQELEEVVLLQVGQRRRAVGRRVGRQVAAGDQEAGAAHQVVRQGAVAAGQVGVGDAARGQVQGVLEVVQDDRQAQLVQAVDGQPKTGLQGQLAVG